MPRRFAIRGIAAVLMAIGLLSGAGSSPAWAGVYVKDLYLKLGYEHQIDSRTCTAAGTAMMLNFIARRDLRLDQAYILRWEQTRDTLDDRTQRGSDPLGWSRALTNFSSRAGRGTIPYRWESYTSEATALKHAARVIAERNVPVGLLVAHGTHAMVMSGFEATSDPRKGDFRLLAVWVSDPNGSTHRRYVAAESPLDTYRETDSMYAYYDQAWYGRFVIVAAPI
jgi:hypothetical protein